MSLGPTIHSTVLLWGWDPSAHGLTRVLGIGSVVDASQVLTYITDAGAVSMVASKLVECITVDPGIKWAKSNSNSTHV